VVFDKSTSIIAIFTISVKRLLAIIPLLFWIIQVHAQVLRGTVKDGISNEMLSTVTITNEKTNQKAYSDAQGFFTINANKGDAVTFALVGYKPQQYTVPSAIGSVEMHISLFEQNYELDEFTLRPKFTPYQLDSMERRSTYSRALARQKGGSIASPVTFVAEKLSKRSKRMFQFQKDFSVWEKEKFIATRYTTELVTSQTGLKGDTLAYFMNGNPLPYDFARAASELELKTWVREQYKEWMKNPVYPINNLPFTDTLHQK